MNNSPKAFDPVKCYEQLRSNILTDPHYVSRGQYLLQQQGMYFWLNYIEMVNAYIVVDTTGIETVTFGSSGRLPSEVGFSSRLSSLLAGIILTIHAEVHHV
jgi:hypothetical protein